MATAKKIKAARAPSVSLGTLRETTTNGLERVIGLDAGMDATLALQAPPGGPDRGTVKADPGPPPPMPIEPLGVWPFGLSRITAAGIARDRAAIQAFDTMRYPPRVGIYKHELLEWIDAIERYEAANKK